MNQKFNLYDERKDAVVTVTKIDNVYHIVGIKGTQLQHIDRTVLIDELQVFKDNFNLKHAEELEQMSLEELL